MENKIIAVQWGDHYEESLYEMIDYMRECEGLDEDEIVGIEVELCEEANVYSDKDYKAIQDIIYDECEIYDNTYFQEKREKIMELVDSVKYYNSVKKYIITKKDYDYSF